LGLADRLNSEEMQILFDLELLRNRAVHSLEPEITITDALRYNDVVNSLISKLQQHRNPAPVR
jgi:hypothetical protein